MNDQIREALARDRTIDITTTGRQSGRPRRIETWGYPSDGQVYLTGLPGQRDWYANLLADPAFVFHVKRGVTADLPAHASPILDPGERRVILTRILTDLGSARDLDAWVEGSPLMVVRFDEETDLSGGP